MMFLRIIILLNTRDTHKKRLTVTVRKLVVYHIE